MSLSARHLASPYLNAERCLQASPAKHRPLPSHETSRPSGPRTTRICCMDVHSRSKGGDVRLEQGGNDRDIPAPPCTRRLTLVSGCAIIAAALQSNLALAEGQVDRVGSPAEQQATTPADRQPTTPSAQQDTGGSAVTSTPTDAGAQGNKPSQPDTTITARVFMDIVLCPTATRENRGVGDASILCSPEEGEPLGRIVIGLYGKSAPSSVSQFKKLCTGAAGASYRGTIFHRVYAGEFLLAGKQGRPRMGEVDAPVKLGPNNDLVRPESFSLTHSRPGTVSYALAENDDIPAVAMQPGYRNTQFLITTGPGPVPYLDGRNIVIGTVLQGMDVVRAISEVPVFLPNERLQGFNKIAEMLGDSRAQMGGWAGNTARSVWNKPLRAVVIANCGLVEPPQVLPPSLP